MLLSFALLLISTNDTGLVAPLLPRFAAGVLTIVVDDDDSAELFRFSCSVSGCVILISVDVDGFSSSGFSTMVRRGDLAEEVSLSASSISSLLASTCDCCSKKVTLIMLAFSEHHNQDCCSVSLERLEYFF